jgi:hypothetical protein
MKLVSAAMAAIAASVLAGCSLNLATTSSDTSTAELVAARHAANGLVYSRASARRAQRMPAPGSCHYRRTGLYALPDRRCAPGALNPAVTLTNIHQTICRPGGYTRSVRPTESVTEPEKREDMAAYGNHGRLSQFEFDHLVPLALGGAANDPRNYWPEPDYTQPQDGGYVHNPKDRIEEVLTHDVCTGKVPLGAAQHAIAGNWTTALEKLGLAP